MKLKMLCFNAGIGLEGSGMLCNILSSTGCSSRSWFRRGLYSSCQSPTADQIMIYCTAQGMVVKRNGEQGPERENFLSSFEKFCHGPFFFSFVHVEASSLIASNFALL